MGAWGSGVLEDDGALDFLDALRGSDRPHDEMRLAFEVAAAPEDLDYDAGQAALVSAAVLDAVLNGGTLAEDDEELRAWLATLAPEQARELCGAAVKACRKVLAPGSELDALWSENAEEYPRWKGGVERLIARLGG